MKFHLEYQPPISDYKITHQSEIILIGSCFSDHIGKRLRELKFNVDFNPLGIVFNPKSIAIILSRIIHKNYFTEKDVFEKSGLWYSLEAHSSIYETTKELLINQLNQIINKWHIKLKSADVLMITMGSAWVYSYKQTNLIVANCHKLPSDDFEKKIYETHEIIVDFQILIDELKEFNPKLKLLFTVSPVKHLRDGLVENNLSKAILVQSVYQLVKQNINCFYFPAYELVTDDLRDYRFYESDMAHPNLQAIDYVWKKFSTVYFNNITTTINDRIIQIHQAYHHRLLNKNSESSAKFKHNFYQKCVTLQAEYTYLDLTKELKYFNTIED